MNFSSHSPDVHCCDQRNHLVARKTPFLRIRVIPRRQFWMSIENTVFVWFEKGDDLSECQSSLGCPCFMKFILLYPNTQPIPTFPLGRVTPSRFSVRRSMNNQS